MGTQAVELWPSEPFPPFDAASVQVLLDHLDTEVAREGDGHATLHVRKYLNREAHRVAVLEFLRKGNDDDQYEDADLLCAAWRWTATRWPWTRCESCWLSIPEEHGIAHRTLCSTCAELNRCEVCKVAVAPQETTDDNVCEACRDARLISFPEFLAAGYYVARGSPEFEHCEEAKMGLSAFDESDDAKPVRPVGFKIYPGGVWVARQADGQYHTVVEREDATGSEEKCASLVYAWARAEGVLPEREGWPGAYAWRGAEQDRIDCKAEAQREG